VKRSKQEGSSSNPRDAGDMQVDAPTELSRRLQEPRSRSRSPPPSRGIAIFGASRNNGTATATRAEDSTAVAASDENTKRIDSQDQARTRSPKLVGAEVAIGDTISDAKPRDTSSTASNGLPARPAGFASLPPKPVDVVPPPDFSRAPLRSGSSGPGPALLDSYRPGPPPRRPSSRGPPLLDTYQPPPPKEPPILDRYVPRRAPSGRGSRVREG
jgi:hypothetical protein